MKLTKPFRGPCKGALALLAAAMLAGCGGGGDNGLQACLQGFGNGGVVVGSGLPGDPAVPEAQSGYKTGKKPVLAANYMV